MMHKAQLISVPEAFFLASINIPVLKGMWVVSEGYRCHGFFKYLSTTRAFFMFLQHFVYIFTSKYNSF
jgi:hypothetical protein